VPIDKDVELRTSVLHTPTAEELARVRALVRRFVPADQVDDVDDVLGLTQRPAAPYARRSDAYCKNGHRRTGENTKYRKNGVKYCNDCVVARETARTKG
jgi:hypothetical protein